MSADWKIQITAPNGAVGETSVPDADDAAIVDHLTSFLGVMRANDPEAHQGTPGQPADVQPMRQAPRKPQRPAKLA